MRATCRRGLIAGAAAAFAFGAAPASGATVLGSTEAPIGPCSAPPRTLIQTVNPAGMAYAAPAAGVITRWTFQGSAVAPPTLELKVARAAGPNFFVVGESAAQTPAPNTLNIFNTRIPVLAGDIIGLTLLTSGPCGIGPSAGSASVLGGDPAPGSTVPVSDTVPMGHITIGAVLEADADNDGFGDETQDLCPANPAVQAECSPPGALPDPPPETTISSGPKRKTEKPAAKFKFTSNEPAATFQCKLKGEGLKAAVKKFAPCTSPKKYEDLVPGRYKFSVFATDGAGNADATPAERKFSVVDTG